MCKPTQSAIAHRSHRSQVRDACQPTVGLGFAGLLSAALHPNAVSAHHCVGVWVGLQPGLQQHEHKSSVAGAGLFGRSHFVVWVHPDQSLELLEASYSHW